MSVVPFMKPDAESRTIAPEDARRVLMLMACHMADNTISLKARTIQDVDGYHQLLTLEIVGDRRTSDLFEDTIVELRKALNI